MNSKVCEHFLNFISPTLGLEIGHIKALPVKKAEGVADAARGMVAATRSDWDNSETSWDFRDQPLLRPGLKGATLEASWRNWEAESSAAIRRMQELETENNRLFIAAYGLDGELQPEVPEEQITLARAEARRDMAAFLSYAVGCMMGRYSPDHPGLILANAGDTLREFLKKVGKPLAELTFAPDEDGIIPVLDGEWFEDDIVARTRDFLRATFGEATLKQNLRFIEDSLGKSLDKYFLTDFYKDHLQTYKKRPIYWLFQSPKKGFSALVYVHRYTKDTVNTLLNKYLRDYLKKLEARINHLVHVEATATATKEKTAARKESEKLRKDLKDCQDWERNVILPLAQQRLEIDLDDGVKVNYLKFVGAVQAIPGLAAKED
jgi:primosomal protein N''